MNEIYVDPSLDGVLAESMTEDCEPEIIEQTKIHRAGSGLMDLAEHGYGEIDNE